jgi:hypothetical protein
MAFPLCILYFSNSKTLRSHLAFALFSLNPSLVILNHSRCHSERSEESRFFAQGRLREESHRINELKMEILRLTPQNDIIRELRPGEE